MIKKIFIVILCFIQFNCTSTKQLTQQNEKTDNSELILSKWAESNLQYIEKNSGKLRNVKELNRYVKTMSQKSSFENSSLPGIRKGLLDFIFDKIEFPNENFFIVELVSGTPTQYYLILDNVNKRNYFEILETNDSYEITKKEYLNFADVSNNFDRIKLDYDCPSKSFFFYLITKFNSITVETKYSDKSCKEQSLW